MSFKSSNIESKFEDSVNNFEPEKLFGKDSSRSVALTYSFAVNKLVEAPDN